MSQSADRKQFQRAAGAPLLPETPVRFVLYFVARRRWWFLLLIALEAANSACGISIPLALSRIIKAVTRSQAQSLALIDNLTKPLLLFLALGLGEVLFGSVGRSIQLRIWRERR
jgi:ATP-binding cassette subfamily B protein